jgi:hypothetical protein
MALFLWYFECGQQTNLESKLPLSPGEGSQTVQLGAQGDQEHVRYFC